MSKILEVLLDKKNPKITTSAFRPALPSILAREGASEEMLGFGTMDLKDLPHLCERREDRRLEGLAAENPQDGHLAVFLARTAETAFSSEGQRRTSTYS